MNIISSLLLYAFYHLNLARAKFDDKRNQLNDFLIDKDIDIKEEEIKELEYPDILLKDIDLDISKRIIGTLSPSNSEIREIINKEGIEYLYDLECKNGYIYKSLIDRNISLSKRFDNNKRIDAIINLARKEKDNKEVLKLLNKENNNDCVLCEHSYLKEEETNLRYYKIYLNDHLFYLQFSPYSYFKYHLTLIDSIHQNLKVDENTFSYLLAFIKEYPKFFIGSNTGIKNLGGSLINHLHYQGGKYDLPIFDAKDLKVLFNEKDNKISLLDYYSSVIKIESYDEDFILDKCKEIYFKWLNYDNEKLNIVSFSDNERHNALIPIFRNNNNKYEAYLILRNNYCNSDYPDGVFNTKKEHRYIKSEAVALFECAGLFILPSRIKELLDSNKETEDSVLNMCKEILLDNSKFQKIIS